MNLIPTVKHIVIVLRVLEKILVLASVLADIQVTVAELAGIRVIQGRIGHITSWDFSHGIFHVLGPLAAY
jgi:hypothetical protein